MTSFIQLITFCVSFIYGIFMTVIYVIILYKLNNGYFHIYFILMVFIGYYVGYLTKLLLLSKTNVKNLINKLKK